MMIYVNANTSGVMANRYELVNIRPAPIVCNFYRESKETLFQTRLLAEG